MLLWIVFVLSYYEKSSWFWIINERKNEIIRDKRAETCWIMEHKNIRKYQFIDYSEIVMLLMHVCINFDLSAKHIGD